MNGTTSTVGGRCPICGHTHGTGSTCVIGAVPQVCCFPPEPSCQETNKTESGVGSVGSLPDNEGADHATVNDGRATKAGGLRVQARKAVR